MEITTVKVAELLTAFKPCSLGSNQTNLTGPPCTLSLLLNSVYVIFKVDLAFTRLHHLLRWRQQKLLLLTGKGRKRSFTHPWKLSAALGALEPKVQSGLTHSHVKSQKNLPRILAGPKKVSGKVNPIDWLHKKEFAALWWWLPAPPTWTRFVWALLLPLYQWFEWPSLYSEKKPEALHPPSLNPVSAANMGGSVWFPISNWTYHRGSWQPCATSHPWVILHRAPGISSREILHSVVSGSSSIL